jgi:hypothetical protein
MYHPLYSTAAGVLWDSKYKHCQCCQLYASALQLGVACWEPSGKCRHAGSCPPLATMPFSFLCKLVDSVLFLVTTWCSRMLCRRRACQSSGPMKGLGLCGNLHNEGGTFFGENRMRWVTVHVELRCFKMAYS